MKLNKYIGIAVMPLLFTACENDMMESMQQKNQPIYTLSGIMDKGVNSRAQIQLGNPDESGEIFMWNEGDCFNLYQGGPDSEVTFNISSSYTGNKSTATFSSENPVYPGTYVAVYPQVKFDEENRFIFEPQTELDFSKAVTQEEKDAVWKEYFKNNMFMIAQGELTMDGPNALQFEQQCALIRITYHNKSGKDQVLNYVSLCGQNQFYGAYRHQNMDLMGHMGSSTSWYQLNFNGMQVAANESTDFYIFIFPNEFGENGIMEMYFSVQGGNRSVSVPVSELAAANNGAKGFEAGMRYWFDVTATSGGAVLSKNYSTTPITFKNVEFAKALQGVLGSDMVSIDEKTGYGTMIEGDVMNITTLDFGNAYQFTSLEGIENFKNLNYLVYYGGSLTECDLSKNTKLQVLDVENNQNLTSMNISNCHELHTIYVSNTGLTSLNIPNKAKINTLAYSKTALSFDLEEFTNLYHLQIMHNGLTSLDMIPATIKARLIGLTCSYNSIESIDLSEFTNLSDLSIAYNNLKSLDLSPAYHLTNLSCYANYIERLDISSSDINSLSCGSQKDDITLILVANDQQKDRWRNDWCHWSENQNAYLEGEEPKDIPEGGGTGKDFENGGEF